MKHEKKLLTLLLNIIILVTLSGCVTHHDVDDDERRHIFASMQSQDLISDDLTFVEIYTTHSMWFVYTHYYYYYIYKDGNGNYIGIRYSNESSVIDYGVTIYDVSLAGNNEYEINESIAFYRVTEQTRIVLFWTFRNYSFDLYIDD